VETRQRKLEVFLVAVIALGPVPVCGAVQEDSAAGRLTLNGTTVQLTHAYASAQPGFFDKSQEDIRVLLSDVILPNSALSDVFDLIHLARDGKARVVEVVLNATKQPISGAIYAPQFEGMVSVTGMHRFESTAFERARVAGRLSMEEPRTFQGVTFQYDATFTARVPRPPSDDEVAAALAGPPARAASAYLTALQSGSLPAFLAMLSPSAQTQYAGTDGRERFAQLRAETPANCRVIGLTTPTSTSAIATVNGTRDGIVIEFSLELSFEAGTWRVVRAN
jgi:hypothetical protein